MQLWEAIKALENGKKIRKKSWSENIYMHLVPDSFDGGVTLKIVGSDCHKIKHYNFKFYLGNDWVTVD